MTAVSLVALVLACALGLVIADPSSIARPVTVTNSTTITTTETVTSTGAACTATSQTVTIENESTTDVETCNWPLAALDGQGCFTFGQGLYPQQLFGGDGPELCINGAPAGTVVDWYTSGLVVATFPNGTQFRCNTSTGGPRGPCIVGIP
jgi:hypothetical protein